MRIIIIQNKKKMNNKKLIKKKTLTLKMKYKKKELEICRGPVQRDNKKRKKQQIFQIDFLLLELGRSSL